MTELYIPEAAQLLARGRRYAVNKAPYLSELYVLVPVQVEGIGTMGVTAKSVLYYDPVWLLTDPELKDYDVIGGIYCHEAMHPALNHITRVLALSNHEVGNLAADETINPPLLDAGWKLPSYAVHPEKFGFKKGLTLEQYYALHIKNPEKTEQHEPKVTAGKCGGGAGNAKSKELEAALDQADGRSKADIESARKATANKLEAHAAKHGWGDVAGALKEAITTKAKHSSINWRYKLRHVLGRATGMVTPGGDDYSMARPSMYSGLLGVIRPGLVDQQPTIAFIRDTSGSMDEDMLAKVNSEIINVMKHCSVEEVWLLDADVKVQRKPTLVSTKMIPTLPALGRGGTSFKYALEAVAAMKPRPDVVFYMTDGYGDNPAKIRGLEVIWCTIPPCRKPADWGTVVECKD